MEPGASLRHRWSFLWQGLPSPTLEPLLRRYGESHRHYHNTAHIVDCLEQLQAWRASGVRGREGPALDLAIFFQDAVYDPQSHDNEEASAVLARRTLERFIGPAVLDDVVRLILATRHTELPMQGDEQVVVDIDLSILGRSAPEFDAYERAIRREYDFVPEEQFRSGRAAVLRQFLGRARIYSTAHFYEYYEAAAQANLGRSLAQLR